jgi:hypothetical protein
MMPLAAKAAKVAIAFCHSSEGRTGTGAYIAQFPAISRVQLASRMQMMAMRTQQAKDEQSFA